MHLSRSGDVRARESFPVTLLMDERRAGDSPSTTFRNLLVPRLISSLIDWQNWIEANASDPVKHSLEEYEALMGWRLVNDLVGFVRGNWSDRMAWSDGMYSSNNIRYRGSRGLARLRDDAQHLFPDLLMTQVVMDADLVVEPDSIPRLFDEYIALCRYAPWAAFRDETGVPYGAKLSFPMSGLPVEIHAGDISWQLVFNRYYVPSHIRIGEYRRRYFGYLARQYEQESDMQIKLGVFRGIFERMPGDRISVLDAASGTGLAWIHRPSRVSEMLGIDESDVMVEISRQRGEPTIKGKIEDISSLIPDRKFDYVMASFWDYWVSEADKPVGLSELKNILKLDGKIVFNVHKPVDGWEEKYRKMLLECGYTSVSFSQEEIERTGGGVYTAYYVVAEV